MKKIDDLPPLERLKTIMARLRAADGCRWDLSQTHKSLMPYLIEETYEVVEAIESGHREKLKEELIATKMFGATSQSQRLKHKNQSLLDIVPFGGDDQGTRPCTCAQISIACCTKIRKSGYLLCAEQ